MPGTVRLVDTEGQERDVPTESAGQLLQDPRWRLSTTDDTVARLSQQAKEADFGGVSGAVKAGTAGLLRGATLGLSDAAARGIYGDDAAIALEGYKDVNPGISTGSEIIGAIAPVVLSGGTGAAAFLPASMAGRAGAVAGELAGAGIRGALARGAAEGALYGAGQGVSDVALSDSPLELERAASTIGINALVGAGVGAGASGLARGVERGLSGAKSALDGWLERQATARAARDIAPSAVTGETDVALLDKRGLKAAQDLELAQIDAGRAPARQALADDLVGFSDEMSDSAFSKFTGGVPDASIRRGGKQLVRADFKLRSVADNPLALAEKPERALDALQRQQTALETMLDWSRAQSVEFNDMAAKARADIVGKLDADKLEGYVRTALSPAGYERAVETELDRQYGDAFRKAFGKNMPGKLSDYVDVNGVKMDNLPRHIQAIPDIRAALAKNQEFQKSIAALTAEPASERLAQIAAAQEKLVGGPEATKSAAGILLDAVAPFAGPVGAVATSGAKAIGKLRNAASIVAEKSGQAASRFLGVAAPIAGAAEKYAAPVATKVLSAVRFGDHKDEDPKDLAGLFNARSAELRELTHYSPDGSVQMRPDARIRMADKFDGIRAVDPITADRLETKAARKIEWLSSQLPRMPDIAGAALTAKTWRPPELEMRSWARKVAAADDPNGVFERALHGAITPEDVQAMTNVHPEMLADWVRTVTANLPQARKLSHQKRLALSMLTGVPVDPAMDPRVLGFLQSQFTAEPGSEQGTQAPRAMPAFGSVKQSIEVATPAQARQEHAI